jgi:hypothetical protein
MGEGMTIRVAAPLADDLVREELAEPVASDRRSEVLDLFVQAAVVMKDVSSVLLTVAGGVKGLQAILDWLRGRDLEGEIELTINLPDGARSWSLRARELDDATLREIARVAEALSAPPGR